MNSIDILKNSTVFPLEEMGHSDIVENSLYPQIAVIGAGSAGCSIVSQLNVKGIDNVRFAVVDTDMECLEQSTVMRKIQQPPDAQQDVEKSVSDNANLISAILKDGIKMVFIITGLGGNTGVGIARAISRITKRKQLLTVMVATLPFHFEGDKTIRKAVQQARVIGEFANATVLVNNARLQECYADLTFTNAFSMSNRCVSEMIENCVTLCQTMDTMAVDLHDLLVFLHNAGATTIVTDEASGHKRIRQALEKIAASPLNKLAKPFSAKKVLVKIYYSNAPDIALKIGEMDQLNEFMHNFATDIEVCWSISIDNSLGEKVRITLLSSQLELQLENEFRETYGDEFATGTMNETNNPETETELF